MASLLPFLWGSCIPYNMPVYPGALRMADTPEVGDDNDRHVPVWAERLPDTLAVAKKRR